MADTPSLPAPEQHLAAAHDNADARPANPDADGGPSHIVAIGASAGGLEALVKFFTAMPVNTGMAFVVIQHLSPDYKSVMDELLERFNGMPVVTVTDRTRVRANCIYIMLPGRELIADGNELISRERSKEGVLFLPINRFFRSLAKVWGDNGVGIILSGTGSDGSHGVLDIRDAGGVVLVESLTSARFTGMPQSAIATGCVDAVLPPEDMPKALQAYLADPKSLSNDSEGASEGSASGVIGINDILELLKRTYRADFNHYKPTTINRRIERRVTLHNSTIKAYYELLASSPEALSQLYRDLLIGVTRFFRDTESFDVLKRTVIPELLNQVNDHEEVRIWDCGCATGEEAYSVAILFLDAIEKSGRPRSFKILATDLNQESIYKASAGVYPADALTETPPELIHKYFDAIDDQTYRVKPELRRCMVFSQHNLINDPPFTKMHLVVCRNLLIYLKQEAQTLSLSSFHYALQLKGYLFLGSSESLGDINSQFETIDRFWKIYRKTSNERLQTAFKSDALEFARQASLGLRRTNSPLHPYYDRLLAEFVPSGFLISEELDVLHVFGDAKNYLRLQTGPASTAVADYLINDLQLPVASAIRTVQRKGASMSLPGLSIKHGDDIASIQLKVIPVSEEGRKPAYMVIIDKAHEAAALTRPAQPAAPTDVNPTHTMEMGTEVRHYLSDLETELARTRESLQATVEELEASNEELQASNEELLASNEELQSTNEELHSVNEELYSVNAEHELKIDELHQSTADMRNLMNSTNTLTVFVDADYKLRLFTPRAFEVISIMAQDIGRDIRHFQSAVNDVQLFEDIGSVVGGGSDVTRYLPQLDGRSYLRTCSPYQDINGHPAGAVINYQDTSTVSRTQQALEKSEAQFETILATAPSPVFVVSADGKIVNSNPAAERHFASVPLGLMGMDVQSLFDVTCERLKANTWHNVATEVQARRLDGTRFDAEIMLGQMRYNDADFCVIFLNDITGRKAISLAQEKALQEAEKLANARANFLANMSHEIRTPLNAIIGSTALLDHAESPQDQAKFVRTIHTASKNLLALINDVLDLAQIEAGGIRLNETPFQLSTLFDELHALFTPTAQARQLTFETHIEGDDIAFLGDLTRLQQVITNLVNNALKFTFKGGVTLLAQLRVPAHEPRVWVHIEVQDTGPGIADEAKAQLFKPFYQVDNSMSRQHDGTGLGLSISHQIITRMGGEIGVNSTVGHGSTFWVDVPLKLAAPLRRTEGAESVVTQLCIFSPSTLPLANALAADLDWHVTLATPDTAGLISLQAQVASARPLALAVDAGTDPIWLDALHDWMETLDDFTQRPVLLRLRDDAPIDHLSPPTPGDWHGMPVYDLHPQSPSESVFNILNTALLSLRGASAIGWLSTQHMNFKRFAWLKDVRVLVVDDNHTNLLVTSQLLEMLGAKTRTTDAGALAINLLSEAPHGYDAVLLDLQMPGLDGMEVTRRLRTMPDLGNLPIVALTGDVLESRRREALSAGMTDFMTKPVTCLDLVTILRRVLESHTLRPIPLLNASTGHGMNEADEAQTTLDPVPGIDMPLLNERLNGHQHAIMSVLTRFMLDFDHLPDRLTHAVDHHAHHEVRVMAHTLKGAAANICAQELRDSAEALETLAKQQKTAELPRQAQITGGLLSQLLLGLRQWVDASKRQAVPASAHLSADELLNQIEAKLSTRQRVQHDPVFIAQTLQDRVPSALVDTFVSQVGLYKFRDARATLEKIRQHIAENS